MASALADILGGERTLGRNAGDRWIALLRAGRPYPALESAMDSLGLTRQETSELLAIPLRTLARRKRAHKLLAPESDRLFRLARIAAHAVDVLGDKERAADWRWQPIRATGGVAPLQLFDTQAGAQEVDDILGRIECGVYS